MTSTRQLGNAAKLGLFISTLTAVGTASAQFTYNDFSSTSGLNLSGYAGQVGNELQLTPMWFGLGGYAWQAAPQYVGLGFETTFRFRVTAPNWDAADGFTFAIQNADPNFSAGPEAWGGGLGFTDVLANSVVVEFDTYPNYGLEPLTPIEWYFDGVQYVPWDWSAYWGDPFYQQTSDNHVAIHTKGTGLNNVNYYDSGIGYGFPSFYIADGQEHTARIRYDATSHTLSIYLDGSSVATATASINLSSAMALTNGSAYVGFTAATGGAISEHSILAWSFDPVTPVEGIDALRAMVTALVNDGVTLPADGQSLYAKLDAAKAALLLGDTATARTKLQDFINQMNAFLGNGRLTPAQGDPLVQAAHAILATL